MLKEKCAIYEAEETEEGILAPQLGQWGAGWSYALEAESLVPTG